MKLLNGKIIDILPKWWSILIWTVIFLSLQGCYTQLAMFYPEPEIEQEEELFYETYSRAVPRLNVSAYAQDGAGQSLGLAYQMMYNRFNGFMGFGNRYNYHNPYYYGGNYYGYDSYNLGGYTMRIPYTDLYASGERKQRTFSTSRGDNSPGTNLNVTRTRSSNTSQSSNSGYSNSSNVSSTRSTSSSTSKSSSSSSGRRVTKRN